MSSSVFYTVGHSTRTQNELIDLLGEGGVDHVVDVRAMPRSRTNPQFNHDVFAKRLQASGIRYGHSDALAGLRKRSKTVADEINGYWRNRSFHNYADYALSTPFQKAIDSLIERGQRDVCALMCAEAVWWRCHRRIIADHLLHRGVGVHHLMNKDHIQPAEMTSAARTGDNGLLIYPAAE